MSTDENNKLMTNIVLLHRTHGFVTTKIAANTFITIIILEQNFCLVQKNGV